MYYYQRCSYMLNVLHRQYLRRGRRGRDRMHSQLSMQSVPITTDVVSSNLDQGEVHNIL